MVILNKIDGLWDELRTSQEIDAEIARQVRTSAQLLEIPPAQVFPVSAQKALLAKVNGDDALLARSRLPQLELALSKELIPAKRHIVGSATKAEIRTLAASVRTILDSRIAGIHEQLAELRGLRGKNQDVVEHMMERIQQEKDLFERGMQRYTALRTVFTQQTTSLYECIGLETLRGTAGETRKRIEASPFTKGVRSAMNDFFAKHPRQSREEWAPNCGNPRDDASDVRAFRQGARTRNVHAAAVLDAQVPEGGRPAGACLQRALQHPVEHGEQGEVHTHEALLRDCRHSRQTCLSTSPTATSTAG